MSGGKIAATAKLQTPLISSWFYPFHGWGEAVYALCFLLASPPFALNWSTQEFQHGLCRSRPGIRLHPSQAPKPGTVFQFWLLHQSITDAGQQMEAVSWSVTGGPGAMPWLTAAPPRMTSLQTGVVSSRSDFGMFLALAKFSTAQQEEHKAHFISYLSWKLIFPAMLLGGQKITFAILILWFF